jgi:hypothetical protein
MRSKSSVNTIGSKHSVAGKSEVHANGTGEVREIVRAANIGQEANVGFRHCEYHLLCDHLACTNVVSGSDQY